MANVKRKETAPVHNANHTKAFEEEITEIYPTGNGYKEGKIEDSLRTGKPEKAYWNKGLKLWEYK
jgi:hypothetical protein